MFDSAILWLLIGAVPLAAAAWLAHDHWLAPARVPEEEIRRRADDLRARHGARAQDEAARRERSAWAELDSREQGIWRRVRRRLARDARARSGAG
ncbi:hypothetical protein [Salinarimonas sp.]|uniref:hypothetical protein n=1 Tax=Salinarimonas sp. TaxID=2766526 RepID=UPI003919DA7C